MVKVCAIPKKSAILPAIKLLTDVVPIKHRALMLITRPLLSSSTMDWINILLETKKVGIPNPAQNIKKALKATE